MLPVGQEALCEWCGLNSWNSEGFRGAHASLKHLTGMTGQVLDLASA